MTTKERNNWKDFLSSKTDLELQNLMNDYTGIRKDLPVHIQEQDLERYNLIYRVIKTRKSK